MSWGSPQGPPRNWGPGPGPYGFGGRGSPNWGYRQGSPRQPRPQFGGWGPHNEVTLLFVLKHDVMRLNTCPFGFSVGLVWVKLSPSIKPNALTSNHIFLFF